jgi:predicted aspartyl protease
LSIITVYTAPGGDEQKGANLSATGATLEVIIRRAGQEFSGIDKPAVRSMQALIDTGASKSLVDYLVAEELGLRLTGQTTLYAVGGQYEAPVYTGILEITSLGFREFTEFVAPKTRHLTSQVILGRPFLQNFIMTYHGPEGVVRLERPSGLLPPEEPG